MTLRIITTNAADAATLTAAGFVSTLPVTNLQLEGRSKVARTTSAAAAVVINGTWAGAQTISSACLYRHNLTGAATWRLQLFAGANQTGAQLYDSGHVAALSAVGWGEFAWGAPWGQFSMLGWDAPFSTLWFTGVSALSFTLTITDIGNPAGYIEAKRLLLGAYFEPQFGPAYGLALLPQDSSQQIRTGAGSLRSEAEATWRRIDLTLGFLSDGERAALFDLMRRVGLKREMFVACFATATDATARDYSLLGKLVQMPAQTAETYGRYSQPITIEEV